MPTTELTREYEGATIPAPGTWEFDTTHSEVTFSVRHMMVSKVRGRFAPPAGTFVIAEDPRQSSVDVDIDAASVDTGEANRDGHLKSPDFFDVAEHPTIHFRSTGVRHVKGDNWTLDGELTVKGVTRPVSLDLEVNGVGRDPYGNVKSGFTATAKLNRDDWGLNWNAALETGGFLIGKEITVEINVEAAVQQ